MFASAISGRLTNFSRISAIVVSVGRAYSHDISPSAKKFFERSASRLVTPLSLTASSVIDVSGIECTWYSASEPSSSGFAS